MVTMDHEQEIPDGSLSVSMTSSDFERRETTDPRFLVQLDSALPIIGIVPIRSHSLTSNDKIWHSNSSVEEAYFLTVERDPASLESGTPVYPNFLDPQHTPT